MNSALFRCGSLYLSSKALDCLAISTILVTCASTAFSILLALLFTQAQVFIHGVAIAAAASNFTVWVLILLAVSQQLQKSGSRFASLDMNVARNVLLFCGILLLLAAAGLNLTTLVWAQLHPLDVANTTVSDRVFAFLKAEFCLCGLAFILQLVFVFCVLQRHQSSMLCRAFDSSEKGDAYLDPLKDSVPRTSISTRSDESQTVLEQRPSLTATSFDAEESAHQHVHQRSRLEPIPGSRPDSPAKTLDGPFLVESKSADLAKEDSPRPDSASSKSSRPSLEEPLAAPRFRPVASRSNTSSPALDESHIHPLFRSDSPLPPPTPTIGTTVTASVYGGRVLSSRSLSCASTRSRSQSPGLGTRPITRSRAGSVNSSARVHQNGLGLSRSQSLEAIRSALLMGTPPGGATPPVPHLLPERAYSAVS